VKSIVLIIPYIGKWPFWFDAYLISIAKNQTINWLFVTDCQIPTEYPSNVRFIPTTLHDLNVKINAVLETEVPLTPRKLCDIRPAYGKIFQEYIKDYDFWGFCDADIVWGDIRKFVTNEMLSSYDIISSRKEALSGHFTIFRNVDWLNNYYKTIPDYDYLIRQQKYMWTEEQVLTKHLRSQLNNTDAPKVFWPTILCNQENGRDSHQEYYLDKWLWKDGKILELKNGEPVDEVMYLHFINWKRTMKYSEIKFQDNPSQFYISCTGIHYQPHSGFVKMLNGVKNFFDGYYLREYRRIKKMKFKSLIKRVKRKLKKL